MEQKQSLRELWIVGPKLCGFNDVESERFGTTARLIWDEERNNKDSAYADKDDGKEHPGQRIKHAFMWLHECTKHTGKATYMRKLSELCALRHEILFHGQEQFTEEANILEAQVAQEENLYPDVAAVYSVEQAAQGVWW